MTTIDLHQSDEDYFNSLNIDGYAYEGVMDDDLWQYFEELHHETIQDYLAKETLERLRIKYGGERED